MTGDRHRPYTGLEERAFKILAFLEEHPASAEQACQILDLTRAQFDRALKFAREDFGPKLGIAIPHPVPEDGYRYHVTSEWLNPDGTPAIAAGTAFQMRIIESRLRAVQRDVRIALRSADSRSVTGRKANFLNKHVTHILDVLAEIGPTPPEEE
jgi:hypothetical protein